MGESNSRLTEVREYYRAIYEWHRTYGANRYQKCTNDKVGQDGKWLERYAGLLDGMPLPEEAGIEAAALVAHEVLSGCMEWSYCVELRPELPMCEAARRIIQIIEEMREQQQYGEQVDKLRQLRNVGKGAQEPEAVKILIPTDRFTGADEVYSYYAKVAYDDVQSSFQVSNLGGLVALADTNLEHQSKRERREHQDAAVTITFRNARALHFVEDEREDSLVGLVRSGKLEILAVRIGVKD